MSMTLTGMRETKAWLLGRSQGIPRAIAATVTAPSKLAIHEILAKDAVQSIIYAVYDPKKYKRTFETLNNVKAVVLSTDPPEFGITIDLTGGTRAKLGGGDVTYARFMLPDFAQDSFWKGEVRSTLPRDFLGAWLQIFSELVPEDLVAALDAELSR
jgi:hypothetical protein